MSDVNILAIQPVSVADRAKIEAVDRRIRLTDAGGWFDGEIRDTWPEFATRAICGRTLRARGRGRSGTRCWPRRRSCSPACPFRSTCAPARRKLKWLHQRPAGASNLVIGDLWKSDVVVTTSRGYGNSLAIAEYALRHAHLFRQGPAPGRGRPQGRPVRPPRLPAAAARGQDRLRHRRRRDRPGGRQALRRRSACASSARGVTRRKTRPSCRRASPSCARRMRCTRCWRRATSSPSAASGRRRRRSS